MKGVLKVLLGLVALVVVVLVAGGVILGLFIDPNDYKAEIEKVAKEKAGIELQVGGNMDWSLFPWLGIEINQITARYPGQPELASLNQAKVSVQIAPLLSGEVKMSSVVVDGLTLNLSQNAEGNNWTAPAGKTESAPAQQTESTPANAGEASGGAAIALDIESIAITNGNVSFDDAVSGTKVTLKDFNLNSGQVVTGAFFPIDMSFNAEQQSGGKTQLTVVTKLAAEALLDLENQQYQLKGLNTQLNLAGPAVPNQKLALELKSDVATDLQKQNVSLKNLTLVIANLSTQGNLVVNNFAAPEFSGDLKIAPFDLNKLLAEMGQPAVKTTDPEVLKKISLSAKLAGPANTLALNDLSLKLDDTTFNGQLSYALTNGAIKLALKGDDLNADRYLPPQQKKAAAKESSQSTAASGSSGGKKERYSKEPVIPVEPLKALNLDADIGLQKLQINGIKVSNLQLVTSAHGGLVKASKINADLYGGKIRNSATIDARKSPLLINGKKNITGIQIGEMLKDLAGEAVITGSLNAKSDVTVRGRSVYDIVNTMTGTANVNVTDGVINGIDMAQTICQGFNNVAALGVNAEQVDTSTPFANMGGNFQIKNGLVSNKDLKAKLDAMSLGGRGNVNLPKALVDYRLGLKIEEDLFKQTCSVNNKLQGVEWPVNCKGSFDTPPAKMCRPDLSVIEDLLKQEVKRKVEEKVKSKVEDKLKDKLEGQLGDKLKGLFN